MKKKHLIIVGTIIISAIVILGLYQTFALSGDITKDTSGYYNVTVNTERIVTVHTSSYNIDIINSSLVQLFIQKNKSKESIHNVYFLLYHV